MNILVLNGSPAGSKSVTLYTMKYIQKHFPEHRYEVLDVGQRIRSFEKDFTSCRKALSDADLILFSYPVYTFLVPAQLHRFMELIKQSKVDLSGKFAAQISTSMHFYDVTAHAFIEENCADLSLRYIKGLSADMNDLCTAQGRKDACAFFEFVLWSCKNGIAEPSPLIGAPQPDPAAALPLQPVPKQSAKAVIVTDFDPAQSDAPLAKVIEQFRAVLPLKSEVVNLRTFEFAGGCLGCFHCAAHGECIYKDRFDVFLRENIQSADAIVYAFEIKDHSMGYRFKLYDDRQFCNGHRTVTMGKPVAYLVRGNLAAEPNLRLVLEARAQVGGNYLAGIANQGSQMPAVAAKLAYAVEHHYLPPKNFFGVGGMKIFRDLIYQMRGLMREDHRFYKAHGFYDFPQKRKARIAGMYAVGTLMNSKKLRRKTATMMRDGMVMPYEQVLKKY